MAMLHDLVTKGFMGGDLGDPYVPPSLISKNRKSIAVVSGEERGPAAGRERELVDISEFRKQLLRIGRD
jgi:hypothetical protein